MENSFPFQCVTYQIHVIHAINSLTKNETTHSHYSSNLTRYLHCIEFMWHECIGKFTNTFDHTVICARKTKYRCVELIDGSEYRATVLQLTMTLLKSHFEMIDAHRIRLAETRRKTISTKIIKQKKIDVSTQPKINEIVHLFLFSFIYKFRCRWKINRMESSQRKYSRII